MAVTVSSCEAGLSLLPEDLLIGVSGGMDSVALLHALVACGRKPTVVHYDHRWRQESTTDAVLVRNLARKAGLKYLGGKARTAPRQHKEGEAREQRYAFFASAAERTGIADLVLAHQADDQVETYLLQLLRGSGSGGIGMRPVTRRGRLIIHRPWLGLWRREIAQYARLYQLTWREDASNDDPAHRRNLVRGRVLPYLKRQISPRVAENLLRAAEIARVEGEWLDALCAEEAARATLDAKALAASPPARQRRLVLRWLQARGIGDISFADVEAVRALSSSHSMAKQNLAGGKFARRRAGVIFIE